jgi:hypothetical protein
VWIIQRAVTSGGDPNDAPGDTLLSLTEHAQACLSKQVCDRGRIAILAACYPVYSMIGSD